VHAVSTRSMKSGEVYDLSVSELNFRSLDDTLKLDIVQSLAALQTITI